MKKIIIFTNKLKMKKMKKLLILLLAIGALNSCKKISHCEKEKTYCETVSPDLVPNEVATSFVNLYSNSSVDVWFNQDGKGYTAAFTQNDINMFAMFDTDGSFIKEYSKEERDDYYSKDGHKGKKHHKKGKVKGKKDHKKKKASCICEVEHENEIEED